MISAELCHNPYLLETTVLFNGQKPKVNSQIEKYEHKPLYTWVDKVPKIFYDELNGYDFDLYFIGTNPDFEEVKKAFIRAGVSEDQVRIIHKKEIADVRDKSNEILKLLGWLADRRNRKFDYDAFKTNYSSFFEDAYPIVVINGKEIKMSWIPIGIDSVGDATELRNTVLSSTPIVYCISSGDTDLYKKDIELLRRRDDVTEKQVFFILSPSLSLLQKERTIADLSINRAQILDGKMDTALRKYMENYPVTEFIRDAISIFRKYADDISSTLDKENEESLITNAEVHNEISDIEAEIASIKKAEEFFKEIGNYTIPAELTSERIVLTEAIEKWKNRKTKITDEKEIEYLAGVFDSDIEDFFERFISAVKEIGEKESLDILTQFQNVYQEVKINDGFSPNSNIEQVVIPRCPRVRAELVKLKDISYVEKNKDLLGGIFKWPDVDPPEKVRTVTCYLEQWRNKSRELIKPVADDLIADFGKKLDIYYHELAEDYRKHLQELLVSDTKRKEQIAEQLSGDERLLQMDNDWLAEFKDRLEKLERE